jgi:hypothetical protein
MTLALLVLSEFDWSLIPGPAFLSWEQATHHLRDAALAGRGSDVRELATQAIERSDLAAPGWTDVVDAALGLMDWIELDARAIRVVQRVASEHWNAATRDHAAAILEDAQSQA